MGDSAEVFNQLITSHAYTEVANSNFAGFLVGGDLNFKVEVSIEDVSIFLCDLVVPQLFGGVGRIRDELANKDLFVGVKGMNYNIEDLFNLGSELVALRRGCACHNLLVLEIGIKNLNKYISGIGFVPRESGSWQLRDGRRLSLDRCRASGRGPGVSQRGYEAPC